jgi:hypothetical protein
MASGLPKMEILQPELLHCLVREKLYHKTLEIALPPWRLQKLWDDPCLK